MDGFFCSVLAVSSEYRVFSLSLPLFWRWLYRWSLYCISSKGVDCNVKADRSGSGGFSFKIRLLCHGIRDPCRCSSGAPDLWGF